MQSENDNPFGNLQGEEISQEGPSIPENVVLKDEGHVRQLEKMAFDYDKNVEYLQKMENAKQLVVENALPENKKKKKHKKRRLEQEDGTTLIRGEDGEWIRVGPDGYEVRSEDEEEEDPEAVKEEFKDFIVSEEDAEEIALREQEEYKKKGVVEKSTRVDLDASNIVTGKRARKPVQRYEESEEFKEQYQKLMQRDVDESSLSESKNSQVADDEENSGEEEEEEDDSEIEEEEDDDEYDPSKEEEEDEESDEDDSDGDTEEEEEDEDGEIIMSQYWLNNM